MDASSEIVVLAMLPYLFNRNDPVTYADPSGLDTSSPKVIGRISVHGQGYYGVTAAEAYAFYMNAAADDVMRGDKYDATWNEALAAAVLSSNLIAAERSFATAGTSSVTDPGAARQQLLMGTFQASAMIPGFGTIGRGAKAEEILSGTLSQSGFERCALTYLQAGYKELANFRFVSLDGLRQIRFGTSETSGILHAHFEAYNFSYWMGGWIVENSRVLIK